jgi:hypothetical protein
VTRLSLLHDAAMNVLVVIGTMTARARAHQDNMR